MLYLLRPLIDAAQPVALTMELIVSAGQPVRIDVAGEGPELLASSPLHLGQQLPPVALTLLDEEGPARAPCFRDGCVIAECSCSACVLSGKTCPGCGTHIAGDLVFDCLYMYT